MSGTFIAGNRATAVLLLALAIKFLTSSRVLRLMDLSSFLDQNISLVFSWVSTYCRDENFAKDTEDICRLFFGEDEGTMGQTCGKSTMSSFGEDERAMGQLIMGSRRCVLCAGWLGRAGGGIIFSHSRPIRYILLLPGGRLIEIDSMWYVVFPLEWE